MVLIGHGGLAFQGGFGFTCKGPWAAGTSPHSANDLRHKLRYRNQTIDLNLTAGKPVQVALVGGRLAVG